MNVRQTLTTVTAMLHAETQLVRFYVDAKTGTVGMVLNVWMNALWEPAIATHSAQSLPMFLAVGVRLAFMGTAENARMWMNASWDYTNAAVMQRVRMSWVRFNVNANPASRAMEVSARISMSVHWALIIVTSAQNAPTLWAGSTVVARKASQETAFIVKISTNVLSPAMAAITKQHVSTPTGLSFVPVKRGTRGTGLIAMVSFKTTNNFGSDSEHAWPRHKCTKRRSMPFVKPWLSSSKINQIKSHQSPLCALRSVYAHL